MCRDCVGSHYTNHYIYQSDAHNRDCVGSYYTSYHTYQCDTHSQGHNVVMNGQQITGRLQLGITTLLWVCGHTASSPPVLTHLPPTVTSRASITSHVVHRPVGMRLCVHTPKSSVVMPSCSLPVICSQFITTYHLDCVCHTGRYDD